MEKKPVEYMKPNPWKKIAINDRTKNKQGKPTSLAMERILKKTLDNR